MAILVPQSNLISGKRKKYEATIYADAKDAHYKTNHATIRKNESSNEPIETDNLRLVEVMR
jgi:hypothetical protein